MARADFLFSLVLIALGLFVGIESWRMPRLEELGIEPWSAPGLVPGLLGAIVLGLGLVLCARSVRRGGHRPAAPADPGDRAARRRAAGRFVLALVLTVGYAAGLVGHLPFWLATLIFVTVFIAAFEWDPARSAAGHLRAGGLALLQGAAVAVVVSEVFRDVFLVTLP